MIHFPDFERSVDHKILLRGETCYDEQCVTELNETFPGNWEACVEGSELYTVDVSINQNQVDDWFCDCPYDGHVCKHVVAVLFAIRDRHNPEITLSVGENDEKEERNPETQGSDLILKQMLKLADKQSIIQFIYQYAANNPAFDEELKKRFLPTPNTDHLSTDYSQDVFQSIELRTAKLVSRRRYDDFCSEVDYERTAKNLSEHLEKSDVLHHSNALGDAASIAIQVLMVVADNFDKTEYDYYEDDGSLNDTCDEAGKRLLQIVQHPDATPALKEEIRNAVQQLENESAFRSCDIYDISHLIHELNTTGRPKEEIVDYLNRKILSAPDSYDTHIYIQGKIDLLRSMKREEEASQTVRQYLSIPAIRQAEVEWLIGLGEYQKALPLIDEGIANVRPNQDQYLFIQWNELKLRILTAQHKTDELIAIGRNLFIQKKGDPDIYHLLKKHVASNEWTGFLYEMMAQTQFSYYSSVEPDIYVEEKAYDRLMAWVRKEVRQKLDYIHPYLPYLKDQYAVELLDIYSDFVLRYNEQNLGRNHYQYVVRILKQMQGIKGGSQVVKTIVSDFRDTYKKRHALMEELNMLKL